MDSNLMKMIGAAGSVGGEIEQATKSDFRIKNGVITKYIGSKVKFRLPDGIKEIGEDAFSLNDDIDTVIIPEGVTKIHDSAFATCRGLVYVELPSTLKSIGEGAFMYCNLTSMELPYGLEEIGAGAFMNCRNIHEMIVPETVNRIGFNAFGQMGVPLLSFFSSDDTSAGATVRLPEYFRNVIDKEDLGEEELNIVYYGNCKRDISGYQGTKEYQNEDEISELYGQPIHVPGKTYDNNSIGFLPEEIKIVLPDGYRIDTDYDEEGEETYQLRGGFSYNEEGEETAAFSGFFMKMKSEIKDRSNLVKEGKLNEKFTPGMMLKQAVEGLLKNLEETIGKGKCVILDEKFPASVIMKFYKPFSLLGATIDAYVVFFLVEVSEECLFGIQSFYTDNEAGNEEFFSHLLNVMKAFRVNGEITDVEGITSHMLETGLYIIMDEETEPVDVDLNMGIEIQMGEEKTRMNLNSDGSVTTEKTDTSITYTFTDEALYPHYYSMLSAGGLGMLGVNVVVNQSGTEYKFYNLAEELADDVSEEMRNAIGKLNDTGVAKYKLAERAIEMRSLFHVEPNAFDNKHDRECELAEGMMHRAYMMSALRSFAWTTAAYCDDLEIMPKDLELDQIQKIIDGIAEVNWLNYDGKSFCKGLCGTQDLHVFYLPDRTPKAVKEVFLPSQESVNETKKIQESFPNYNPILDQIGSLNKLRKDLEYIHPAIEKIYESLLVDRNYQEPLDGRDADVLYAWCALAYAARAPFYSEDGPMNCYFEQMPDNRPKAKIGAKKKNDNVEQNSHYNKGTDRSEEAFTKTNTESRKIDFPKADVPESRKKLLKGGVNGEYIARLIPFPAIMDEGQLFYNSFYYFCKKNRPWHQKLVEESIEIAEICLDLFGDDEIDDIKYGYLKTSTPFHALKSFVWTAVEIESNKDKSRFPKELSSETLADLLDFIYEREFVNYKATGQTKKRFGGSILFKQEIKNKAFSYYEPTYCFGIPNTLYTYFDTSSKIDLLSLAEDVNELAPAINMLRELVKNDEIRKEIKETALLIIKGWCLFAFAEKQPFICLQSDLCPFEENKGELYNSIDFNPKVEIVDDGRYIIIDGLVMDCEDNRRDVVIPSEVKDFSTKGMVRGKIYFPHEKYFPYAEKITYHSDFDGMILIPKNVKEVIINTNAENLYLYAVNFGDNELRKLVINGNAKNVYNYGMSGFAFLREVILPDGLERIDSRFCQYCKELDHVLLPEGLKYIEEYAFSGCSIKTVTIPESVIEIEEGAFIGLDEIEIRVYRNTYGQKWAHEFADAVEKGIEYWIYDTKSVHIVELDPSWQSKVDCFVEKLNEEYQRLEKREDVESTVFSYLKSMNINDQQYKTAREYFGRKARENKLHVLENVIGEYDELDEFKSMLPAIIAEDIIRQQKERIAATITSIEKQIEIQDKSIVDFDTKIIDLEEIISANNESISDIVTALGDDFELRKTESSERLKSQSDRIKAIEEEIAELGSRQTEKKNQLNTTSLFKFKIKKELTAEIEQIDNELSEKDVLLSKEKLVLKRIEKENDEQYVKPAKEVSDLRAKGDDLDKQLNETKKKKESLTNNVVDNRKRVISMKEELKKYSLAVDEMKDLDC